MSVYGTLRLPPMRMPHSRLAHLMLRFSTSTGAPETPSSSITPTAPFVQAISETSHVRVASTRGRRA